MSTVKITTGSASGGDRPPNNDREYEPDELPPIEDDDEEETANETENPPKTTEQSLKDAATGAIQQCHQLQAELTVAIQKAESFRSRKKDKAAARTKIRAEQSDLNSKETKRAAAQVEDLRVKWHAMRLRCIDDPDSTPQEAAAHTRLKNEYARVAKVALAAIDKCAKEITTLIREREDLQNELDLEELTITSLRRQLREAETVRRERQDELLTFRNAEQSKQQEAEQSGQQQQQSTQQSDSQQSQRPASDVHQIQQQQSQPTPQQPPPSSVSDTQKLPPQQAPVALVQPQQVSDQQQRQQTLTSATQQTVVPSTVDATNIQAGTSTQLVALTEEALSRIEPMDQTGGPSSNEPMPTEPSSESASSHDDHMKSLDTSFERAQTNAPLPTEQNSGSVLDINTQSGFDPLARTEAPSPADSAATLRQQLNLFRHNAENSAFHSAATSPYGSSNFNASTGPPDSSQPLYDEMLQVIQAAAALEPGNSQQPANNDRQNVATSAASIIDRLRLQPDGNLGWPAQQTPAQPQHPANMSSGQLSYAPPVPEYTAMGLQLQRQQSAPYQQHQQQQVTPQQHQQMVTQQQQLQQMPYQHQLLAMQQQQHQQVIPQQQRMSTPQLYQSSWLQTPSHYAVPEINPGQLHQQGLVPAIPQFQHSTPLHSRPTTPSQQFPQAPQGAYGNFAMPGMLPSHPSLPQQYPGQQPQPVQQQYAPQPQVMPQQHQAAPQQWNAHQQPAQLQQAPPQQVDPLHHVVPPQWNVPTTTAANSLGNIPTTTTSILHVEVSPETEQRYREELNIIMAQLDKNKKVYDEAKVTEREKLAIISQLVEEHTAEDDEATDFDAHGKGMVGLSKKVTAALAVHHTALRVVTKSFNRWETLAKEREVLEEKLATCKVIPAASVTPLSQVLSTPPTTPHQGSTSKNSEPEVGQLIDIEEVTAGDEGNDIGHSQTDVDPGVWIQPPRDRFGVLPDPTNREHFPEENDAVKPHIPQPQGENFSPVIANHGFPAQVGSRGPYYLRLDAYFTKLLATMGPDPNFRLTKNIEHWINLVKRIPKHGDEMHNITRFLRRIRRFEPVLRYLIRERAYPGINPVQYDMLLRYIATKLQAECGKVFDKEFDQFCTPDPAIVITIGFNRILRSTSKLPCASVVRWLTHNCEVSHQQMDDVSLAVELMNTARAKLNDADRQEVLKEGEEILERARVVYGLFKDRIMEALVEARQLTPDSQPHAEKERKREDGKENKEEGSD